MIKIFLKHLIYEQCIETFFDQLFGNFCPKLSKKRNIQATIDRAFREVDKDMAREDAKEAAKEMTKRWIKN